MASSRKAAKRPPGKAAKRKPSKGPVRRAPKAPARKPSKAPGLKTRKPVSENGPARQLEAFVMALVGVGVVALTVGLWLGDELPKGELAPGFVDPGVGTDLGLPLSRMLVDVLAIGTAGMLVTSLLMPRAEGRLSDAARRSLWSAGWLAQAWGVAILAWTLFYWSDILAVPVPQLPGLQLLHGTALSFPEAWRFLVSAGIAVVIGIAALLIENVWGAVILLLLTGYTVLPFTTSGHAEHSPIVAYALTVHVIAFVLWIGGLAGLLVHVRSSPELLAVAVPRFSTLALGCYVAVGVSGIVMAWLNLGSLPELWGSRYGALVLLLATAQTALGVFGWWHRRHAIRAVTTQRSSGPFIRLAAAEVVIMVAAVAFGVALSDAPTPATASASVVQPHPVTVAPVDH